MKYLSQTERQLERCANLGILRNSSCKFELNASSSLGGDVETRTPDKILKYL